MMPVPPRCAILLARAENLDRVDRQHGHAAESPWLADQPVKPLESGPSHPYRRPPDAAREVIECSADSDSDDWSQWTFQAVDPQLLLGGSESDQQDLCAVRANQRQGLVVGGGVRRPWVRRDLELGIRGPQLRCHLARDAWRSAQQKQPETMPC